MAATYCKTGSYLQTQNKQEKNMYFKQSFLANAMSTIKATGAKSLKFTVVKHTYYVALSLTQWR